jgi:crotonobetainyl-CoA:carnitine CoA-transferase CaiB-like acyl-CoA transferase
MEGIRVVELGVWVAGPAAAGILCDWGAEVVKIEPPQGDPARGFTKMLGGDMPTNPPFELDNRGKQSVVLDLATEAGRAAAVELIDGADVFVTNIRASALARIGLDPDTLRARDERLIYALVSGFGTEGPDADAAAYDIAAWWSRAGIAWLLSAPGADPPFQRGGMGDHSVGMTGAAMVCAALVSRGRTGKGQLVTTSLLRQGAYTIGFDLNTYLMWGLQFQGGLRSRMPNVTVNNYSAGDGRRFWIVGLEADRHWPPLARVVGHPEWIDDERYATIPARRENAVDLIVELDAVFATKTLDEWREVFATEPDFFWAPVNSLEDLVADPQFAASGGMVDVPDGVATTTMVNTPADFRGTPSSPTFTAPELGAHTDEVLGRLPSRTSRTSGNGGG